MTTLIEFLRARLDEDEADIRADAGLGLAYGWPARILAEVEAKRVVIDLCAESIEVTGWDHAMDWAWDTLRAFAAPHADHSDFDSAWMAHNDRR